MSYKGRLIEYGKASTGEAGILFEQQGYGRFITLNKYGLLTSDMIWEESGDSIYVEPLPVDQTVTRRSPANEFKREDKADSLILSNLTTQYRLYRHAPILLPVGWRTPKSDGLEGQLAGNTFVLVVQQDFKTNTTQPDDAVNVLKGIDGVAQIHIEVWSFDKGGTGIRRKMLNGESPLAPGKLATIAFDTVVWHVEADSLIYLRGTKKDPRDEQKDYFRSASKLRVVGDGLVLIQGNSENYTATLFKNIRYKPVKR